MQQPAENATPYGDASPKAFLLKIETKYRLDIVESGAEFDHGVHFPAAFALIGNLSKVSVGSTREVSGLSPQLDIHIFCFFI
jgi:hypothetical protein